MLNRRRRRWSIVVLVVTASVAGSVSWLAASRGSPEAVRQLRAVATWNADGTASVHEVIDYRFPAKRHGIYRILPGVGWNDTASVTATADHTEVFTVEPDVLTLQQQMAARGVEQMTVDPDEMTGVRVRIGDPTRTVSGNHTYTVNYPLLDAVVAEDRMGWNGVGTTWDVPVEHVELDIVAPWRWERASCAAGRSGSVGGCVVTVPKPGHLVVTHGRLASGEGITVHADAGDRLAATPTPRPLRIAVPERAWWAQAPAIGGLVALSTLLAGLVTAWLLRRAGRDRVMAGPAGAGAATDLAFGVPAVDGTVPGERRVDDTRLARWATTEFAPPRELAAWQGGILVAEGNKLEHRVAWLLGTAADGYIELDETPSGSLVLRRRDHAPDATVALLEVAFAGRDEVRLGAYDPHFAALWTSLAAMQRSWLERSPHVDHRAERRVRRTRVVGAVTLFVVTMPGIAASGLWNRWGAAAVITAVVAAGIGGAAVVALTRAWELHVRTPAGSAMWLRVESFRRFLAASEAEHVRRAAQLGVLRDHSAWAVALGEADHWNAAVESAGLTPEVPGSAASSIATRMTGACLSTGTAPASAGSGGGSSSSSSSSSSSGGVGGGGGGGGGGSW